MIDFNRLKARSSTGEALAKLQEQSKGKASYKDDREWRADVDKDGNGYAVIRFLDAPPQDGEDGTAYVKYYQHGFKGPGGWYIEKSLTSLGKPDPVSEYNTSLRAQISNCEFVRSLLVMVRHIQTTTNLSLITHHRLQVRMLRLNVSGEWGIH